MRPPAAPPAPAAPRRIAVVGGGWAGIAAAVQASTAGARVTLIEMAPRFGGRARAVPHGDAALDNGQHILIGAYTETLELMRRVGVDPALVLQRLPLALQTPDGAGLRLPPGAALPAFVRGVLGCRSWSWIERGTLLLAATGWGLGRFRCDPAWTVERLCRRLPAVIRAQLIDPLCIAALNTPAVEASASVLLRVLRDALFSGPGAADLLLPRAPLDDLLPGPAAAWLARAGAELRPGQRTLRLQPEGRRWRVDDEVFDAVVLACSASEAARLTATIAPDWSARAAALRYEPIITVYAQSTGSRLAAPMTALPAGSQAPAQFVFDLGAIGGAAGRFAFVVSGARPWLERGADATAEAVLLQARTAFVPGTWAAPLQVLRVLTEKRATFRCTPGLARPPAAIARGLLAAGDYVAGPYPATLEGAVRAGRHAALQVLTPAADG